MENRKKRTNEKTYILSKEGSEDIKISGRKKVAEFLKSNLTKVQICVKDGSPINGYTIKIRSSEEAEEVRKRKRYIEGLLQTNTDASPSEIYKALFKKYPEINEGTLKNAVYYFFRKRSDKVPKKETLKEQLEREALEEFKRKNKDIRQIEKMPLSGEHGFYWRINKRRCS